MKVVYRNPILLILISCNLLFFYEEVIAQQLISGETTSPTGDTIVIEYTNSNNVLSYKKEFKLNPYCNRKGQLMGCGVTENLIVNTVNSDRSDFVKYRNDECCFLSNYGDIEDGNLTVVFPQEHIKVCCTGPQPPQKCEVLRDTKKVAEAICYWQGEQAVMTSFSLNNWMWIVTPHKIANPTGKGDSPQWWEITSEARHLTKPDGSEHVQDDNQGQSILLCDNSFNINKPEDDTDNVFDPNYLDIISPMECRDQISHEDINGNNHHGNYYKLKLLYYIPQTGIKTGHQNQREGAGIFHWKAKHTGYCETPPNEDNSDNSYELNRNDECCTSKECIPFLIELDSFEVEFNANSNQTINWLTRSEKENAGFRVWIGIIDNNKLKNIIALGSKENIFDKGTSKGSLIRLTTNDTSKIKSCYPDIKCLKDKLKKVDVSCPEDQDINTCSEIIHARGSKVKSTIYSYNYASDISKRKTVYYLLESIDTNGKRTFHWDKLFSSPNNN